MLLPLFMEVERGGVKRSPLILGVGVMWGDGPETLLLVGVVSNEDGLRPPGEVSQELVPIRGRALMLRRRDCAGDRTSSWVLKRRDVMYVMRSQRAAIPHTTARDIWR